MLPPDRNTRRSGSHSGHRSSSPSRAQRVRAGSTSDAEYPFPEGEWHYRFHRLPDGCVSPTGYFDGLDRGQVSRSMELLHVEYQKFISSLPSEPGQSGGPSQELVCRVGPNPTVTAGQSIDQESTCRKDGQHGNSRDQGSANNRGQVAKVETNSRELMQIHRLEAIWGKRQWSTRFDIYYHYEGPINLTISTWDRLLYWVWSSLSPQHMSFMHSVLFRLRTNSNAMSNIHYEGTTGKVQSRLQENVIRDYYRLHRSCTNHDIGRIVQRFHLAHLFHSHSAYVQHFHDSKRLPWQTTRRDVNIILVQAFTEELHIPVSVQTIRDQVKEGRHWNELLTSPVTRNMGNRLLLLLPTDDFSGIVRKTADPVWTFLVSQLSNICPKMLRLAQALSAIAAAIKTQGIGFITHPLLGYELRSPTNIHVLTRGEFDACLKFHHNLDIGNALDAIQSHGRDLDPNTIELLVSEDWERKNKLDGMAFLQRAEEIGQSAQREIRALEDEGNRRLHRTVVELSPDRITNPSRFSAAERSLFAESGTRDMTIASHRGLVLETSHVGGVGRKHCRSPDHPIGSPLPAAKGPKLVPNSQSAVNVESSQLVEDQSTSETESESRGASCSDANSSSSDDESGISLSDTSSTVGKASASHSGGQLGEDKACRAIDVEMTDSAGSDSDDNIPSSANSIPSGPASPVTNSHQHTGMPILSNNVVSNPTQSAKSVPTQESHIAIQVVSSEQDVVQPDNGSKPRSFNTSTMHIEERPACTSAGDSSCYISDTDRVALIAIPRTPTPSS
ncbi:hypothetical protein HOY82DRAFT_618876 [Tuber indicum]|nr:hypothetical protein HOY82DRAFT_618876 [Tuber indicum]